MTPLALTLYRFGTFTQEERFEFPVNPGLYFMQGRNELHPQLGGNACGKSTLWRALTWVLFGKDHNNLKAGDIANWTEPKGARVGFLFKHEDEVYEVVRQHAPNFWILDHKHVDHDYPDEVDLTKDETNQLMSMLRLEFSPFLNTVVMAQGEPMFLDMKSEPKAALFSAVMSLDRWDTASTKASKMATAADVAMRALEAAVALMQGRLEGLPSEEHYWEPHACWQAEHGAAVKAIEDEYTEKVFACKEFQAGIPDAEADIERLTKALRDARELETEKSELLAFAVESKAKTYREADDRGREFDRVNQDLRALDVDECPTCGAPHPEDSTRARALRHKAGQLQVTCSNLVRILAGDAENVESAEDGAEVARRKAQEARDALTDANGAIGKLRSLVGELERELDRLEDAAERELSKKNPYDELIERNQAERRRLQQELDDARERLDLAAARYARLGFWVRGFKDIRLQQIAGALGELGIEANNGCARLGLVGWELLFEVDRETASGSISRGFSVYVGSPHNDRAVPWDGWSGGEAQRLRIAGQMGLADLTRSRTGATLPLEVWDEPTKGLNAGGINDMLDALRDRAIAEGRQVWIVDHHVLGYGGFDGTVTVVKDNKGSRFEYDY